MGSFNVIVIVLVILNLSYRVTAEVYSAFSHTERMLSIELELADTLEEYIKAEENKLQKLKAFSRQVQRTVKLAKTSGTKFLEHPVNSYLMIKRFVSQWPGIEELVSNENTAEGMNKSQFIIGAIECVECHLRSMSCTSR